MFDHKSGWASFWEYVGAAVVGLIAVAILFPYFAAVRLGQVAEISNSWIPQNRGAI